MIFPLIFSLFSLFSYEFLVSDYATFATQNYLGVVYASLYKPIAYIRFIQRRTTDTDNLLYPPYVVPNPLPTPNGYVNGTSYSSGVLTALENSHYQIPLNMTRNDFVDCISDTGADTNIHCVFIGPDRTFYHYKFDFKADNAFNFANNFYTFDNTTSFEYYGYRDYIPSSVQITPTWIIAKARSLGCNDNTFLVWKRRDKGGTGYLWSGYNGTISGLNDVPDFDKVTVQMAEYAGGSYIWWKPREAKTAKVLKMYNLEAIFGSPNSIYPNCIGFTKDPQDFCYPTGSTGVIPNQQGTAPIPTWPGTDFWVKLLLWTLVFGILLAGLGYLLSLLSGNPKPGAFRMPPKRKVQVIEEVVREKRPRTIIEEETIVKKRNPSSTSRVLL